MLSEEPDHERIITYAKILFLNDLRSREVIDVYRNDVRPNFRNWHGDKIDSTVVMIQQRPNWLKKRRLAAILFVRDNPAQFPGETVTNMFSRL